VGDGAPGRFPTGFVADAYFPVISPVGFQWFTPVYDLVHLGGPDPARVPYIPFVLVQFLWRGADDYPVGGLSLTEGRRSATLPLRRPYAPHSAEGAADAARQLIGRRFGDVHKAYDLLSDQYAVQVAPHAKIKRSLLVLIYDYTSIFNYIILKSGGK